MKKILLSATFAISVLSTSCAFAQGVAMSTTDIQTLQQNGSMLANGAQSQSPVFNSDGSLSTNSTGSSATVAPTSQKSIVNNATYVNQLSGVQGYQVTSNPGNGTSGGATISSTNSTAISCVRPNASQQYVIGSQVATLSSCSGPLTSIQSLSLNLCTALAVGGSCDPAVNPQNFTNYSVPVGAWTSIPNGNIGAGCTNTGLCQVTIQGSTSGTMNSTTVNQVVAQKQAANGTNNTFTDMTTLASSTTSDQQAFAISARNCALQNQTLLAQGQPLITCDGTASVSLGTASTSSTGSSAVTATCTDSTTTCLRQATQTVNYSQSCTRTFPLTQNSVQWSIPTLACNLSLPAASTGATTSSATPTNSCSESALVGGVLVGSTQGVCDASGNCNTSSWVNSYVFPNQAAPVGSGVAYPAPVAGPIASSCSNQGVGTPTSCAAGGWFAQTVDSSLCTTAAGANMPGCGYCVQPIYSSTCYAQPTASQPADTCGAIPAGCSLTSAVAQASIGGLTTSQTENYSCTQQETSCVQAQTNPGCPVNLAQGLDTGPASLSNPAAFNQAMANTAVMAAISKSGQSAGLELPTIFNGLDSRCRQPVGYLSGLLLNDCCNISLERTGGNRPMHKCTDAEVTLAAARRANQTVYIGDYCSNTVGFWKFKQCVQRTQTYCAFDGMLSELIQTQGRAQLAAKVAAGFGSTQTVPLSFPYYSGAGGWGSSTVVNGVTVVPFQYPAYCSSATTAAAALAANPDAMLCPNVLTQWFASCSSASCGDLPFAPELGSGSWQIEQVDPLVNTVSAISTGAEVVGACDPTSTQCTYQVTAWPASSTGNSMVTNSWSFSLYSSDTSAPANMFSLGDYLFRPHSVAGTATGATMPATITMDVSQNYGGTWTSFQLPTQTAATGFPVPGSTTVIVGSCIPASNTCLYSATGTITATLMPWGTPQNPQCEGFTPAQLGLLNFSTMDLSAWIATIMGKINPPSSAAVGQLAATQATAFYNAMATGGTQTSTSPMPVTYAFVTPTEGLGPVTVQLYASAYWPYKNTDPTKNNDPVLSVETDWGDCSIESKANLDTENINGQVGQAFIDTHTFLAPDKSLCGPTQASVLENITVTITSASGVHYTSLQVTNQFLNLSGQTAGPGESSGGNIPLTLSAPLPSPTPNN